MRLCVSVLPSTEISLGRSVGEGGFSTVRDVVAIDLDEVYDTSDEESKLRRELARSCAGLGDSQQKYVLKTLRTDLPDDENAKGIVDLAIEAEFLAVLQHPHILALRGTANSDPQAPRFFVLLDRLSTTLERKFNFWRKLVGQHAGYYMPCWGYCCPNSPALHSVWKERLTVAWEVATAMNYLHSERIIYRE